MSEYVVDVGSADAEHIAYFGVQATTVFGHPIGERVVRCRDCKYMHIWDVSAIYQNHDHDSCHCLRFVDGRRMTVTEDGFCAWGERRDA